MNRLPPKFFDSGRPLDRPRRQRGPEKGEKAPKAAKAAHRQTTVDEPAEGTSMGSRPEPDLTPEELRREAERRAEAWAGPDVHADDRDEKASRDAEHARAELVKKKPIVGKLAKKGSNDSKGGKAKTAETVVKDGFEKDAKLKLALEKLDREAAVKSLEALKAMPVDRPDRPQDAMALLRAAQDPGAFFKEDWDREGRGEDEEDPEIRAACEEMIRRLFGVPGIYRVGPGKNDLNEPVVIVKTARGFGEASLRQVPEQVLQFATLVVVPYELLPLRRDRAADLPADPTP